MSNSFTCSATSRSISPLSTLKNKGGKLIVVGLFGGNVTISTPTIPLRAMTIQGSYVGSLSELKELVALVQRTGLPSVPISKRPLAAAGGALDDLKAGKVVGRLVLMPN